MKNPLSIVLFGIIVTAFFSQFWISIKDFFIFLENSSVQEALVIVDEPIRISYFIFMLGGITLLLFVTSSVKYAETFFNTKAGYFVTFIVAAVIAVGVLNGGRIITDSIMANQQNGAYTFCTHVATQGPLLRAGSSPSFWIYSRVPEACAEFKRLNIETGPQSATIRLMNQSVMNINKKYSDS